MPVKQATAVLSAPGGEADRVQKMMSARPTLNANQRRSRVRQDVSGASPDGTFVGKGGNTQQFGKAAMSRMPPPQPSSGGVMGDPGIYARRVAAAQGAPGLQGVNSDPGAPPDAEAIGMERAQRPAPLQGQALQDAMMRRAVPMGGALPPDAAEMATRPMSRFQGIDAPKSAPQPYFGGDEMQLMETAGMGGQRVDPAAIDTALAGAQGAGKGFGPGLPPQIMQRLQALRGIQGGGRGPMAGGGMRSFQDFWQGAGGAGQGNVAY